MSYIAIDKDYLESRIAELKKMTFYYDHEENINYGRYDELEDILSQGIEIPVEENWTKTLIKASKSGNEINEKYPTGVIIKPK